MNLKPTCPSEILEQTREIGEAILDRSDVCYYLSLSPHEPEARYGAKRANDWAGYKTHLTETVDGAQANFITDLHVTPANVHDSQALDERDVKPDEQYVDQGYTSGEHIDNRSSVALICRDRLQPIVHPNRQAFSLAISRLIPNNNGQSILPERPISVGLRSMGLRM